MAWAFTTVGVSAPELFATNTTTATERTGAFDTHGFLTIAWVSACAGSLTGEHVKEFLTQLTFAFATLKQDCHFTDPSFFVVRPDLPATHGALA